MKRKIFVPILVYLISATAIGWASGKWEAIGMMLDTLFGESRWLFHLVLPLGITLLYVFSGGGRPWNSDSVDGFSGNSWDFGNGGDGGGGDGGGGGD